MAQVAEYEILSLAFLLRVCYTCEGWESRGLFCFSFLSEAIYNHNIRGHKLCRGPQWQVQLLCTAQATPPQATNIKYRALWCVCFHV